MLGKKKRSYQFARLNRLSRPPVLQRRDRWDILYMRFRPTLSPIPEELDRDVELERTLMAILSEGEAIVGTRKTKIATASESSDKPSSHKITKPKLDVHQQADHSESFKNQNKRGASPPTEEAKAKSPRSEE